MKVSKTLIYTLIIVSIILIVNTIYSNNERGKLQSKMSQLKADYSLLEEKTKKETTLTSIDSLLVNGEYENALNAYEKEYVDSIENTDKDYVKFRIKIAKQFMGLKNNTPIQHHKEEGIVNKSTVAQLSDRANIIKDYDSLCNILKSTKKQLVSIKNELSKKSSSEYLKFKNSKKHILHYVGKVLKRKANGYGIAVFDTGGRYEGEWKNNKRQGKGTFYWADGEYYIGDYKNDFREGVGTYFWTNGKKYIGGWKNDERHGEGVYYSKKGKILAKGIWKKDELVTQID